MRRHFWIALQLKQRLNPSRFFLFSLLFTFKPSLSLFIFQANIFLFFKVVVLHSYWVIYQSCFQQNKALIYSLNWYNTFITRTFFNVIGHTFLNLRINNRPYWVKSSLKMNSNNGIWLIRLSMNSLAGINRSRDFLCHF